jgi:hypothetical protein
MVDNFKRIAKYQKLKYKKINKNHHYLKKKKILL